MQPDPGVATKWRLELTGRPRDLTIGSATGLTEPFVASFARPPPKVDVRLGVIVIDFPRFRGGRASKAAASELTLDATFSWELLVRGAMRGFRVDLSGTALDGLEVRGGATASELILARPRGTVPLRFGSGVSSISIVRPLGVPVRVQVGRGVRTITLDANDFGAVGGTFDWQTSDYDRLPDRYAISMAAGAKDVTIRTAETVPPSRTQRRLATVLFTDIVGSTERAAELGDERWSELLDLHDDLAARAVLEAGGRVVKQTGDGMLAVFEQPGAAIGSALTFRDALREQGIHIRGGVHTGEVEVRDQDVGGIAVHVASRIMDAAAPDEIVVSRTVRELVTGSTFSFEDRGIHTLRGIDEGWPLFAVTGGA